MLTIRVPKKDSIRSVALIGEVQRLEAETDEDFKARQERLEDFRSITVDVKMAGGPVITDLRHCFTALSDRIKRFELKKRSLSEDEIAKQERDIQTASTALYMRTFDALVVGIKGLDVIIGDDEPVKSDGLNIATIREIMELSQEILNLVCLAALRANTLTIDEKKASV